MLLQEEPARRASSRSSSGRFGKVRPQALPARPAMSMVLPSEEAGPDPRFPSGNGLCSAIARPSSSPGSLLVRSFAPAARHITHTSLAFCAESSPLSLKSPFHGGPARSPPYSVKAASLVQMLGVPPRPLSSRRRRSLIWHSRASAGRRGLYHVLLCTLHSQDDYVSSTRPVTSRHACTSSIKR